MSITFKEIVEILEIDAPILFTPKERLEKNNYVFCRYMGEEETKAVQAGHHNIDDDYDKSDVGIHLPDIEIEDYYYLEKKRNPLAVENIINTLSFKVKIGVEDMPLYFAVYCVLHEYGHWRYFMDSQLTAFEFCKKETEERLPYEKTAKEIYKMNDWDPYKIHLAQRYEKEIYRNFTSEKKADGYAEGQFIDAINKVRNYLKKLG